MSEDNINISDPNNIINKETHRDESSSSSDIVVEPNIVTCADGLANSPDSDVQWFALRDLTRANAKSPGYKVLSERGIEVFTPLKWKIAVNRGKRRRVQVPVLIDMLFAHSDKTTLSKVLETIPNIQYRYARGAYCKPIIIRDIDMERFIRATTMAPDPVYYSPVEITALSIGKNIRIIGGPLEGIEGKIVNVRGARKKRILVSIPDFISAVVEVEPDFLEFL